MTAHYEVLVQQFDKARVCISVEGMTSTEIIEAVGEDFANAGMSSYDGMPDGKTMIVTTWSGKDEPLNADQALRIVTDVMKGAFPDLEQRLVDVMVGSGS